MDNGNWYDDNDRNDNDSSCYGRDNHDDDCWKGVISGGDENRAGGGNGGRGGRSGGSGNDKGRQQSTKSREKCDGSNSDGQEAPGKRGEAAAAAAAAGMASRESPEVRGSSSMVHVKKLTPESKFEWQERNYVYFFDVQGSPDFR